MVVVHTRLHMRCCDHHLHAVPTREAQEFERLLDLLRAVVDAGKQVVVQVDHPSSLSGRDKRSVTASFGAVPSNSTACTRAAIGISMSCRRPRATTARVVATPSAIMRMPARMSCSFRPRPTSNPTERLRLKAPVQVRTRSPAPAKPAKVAGRPPRRVPERAISPLPRVIRAPRLFLPKPSPPAMPGAIATTIFTGPPSPTPTQAL